MCGCRRAGAVARRTDAGRSPDIGLHDCRFGVARVPSWCCKRAIVKSAAVGKECQHRSVRFPQLADTGVSQHLEFGSASSAAGVLRTRRATERQTRRHAASFRVVGSASRHHRRRREPGGRRNGAGRHHDVARRQHVGDDHRRRLHRLRVPHHRAGDVLVPCVAHSQLLRKVVAARGSRSLDGTRTRRAGACHEVITVRVFRFVFFFSLSLFLFLSLSVSLSLSPSLCLSLSLSLSLSVSMYLSLCLSLSVCVCLCLLFRRSVCLCLSVCKSLS